MGQNEKIHFLLCRRKRKRASLREKGQARENEKEKRIRDRKGERVRGREREKERYRIGEEVASQAAAIDRDGAAGNGRKDDLMALALEVVVRGSDLLEPTHKCVCVCKCICMRVCECLCVHMCARVCVCMCVYVPHASRVLAEVGSRSAQDDNLNHFDLRKSCGRYKRRERIEGREGLSR
jgi:hypothetical protein